MVKMKNEILAPFKPIFYQRLVNDIYNGQKKNVEDILFNRLSHYHNNIKFSIKISPTKFLEIL